MTRTEHVDNETGEILDIHEATLAPISGQDRLYADGSEKLCPIPLVSPLSRPPSLKDRIAHMVRSGELAQSIRESQAYFDDDDDNYEGFDRNYLDENMPTIDEMRTIYRRNPKEPPQAPEKPPQASDEPPATPPASDKEPDA